METGKRKEKEPPLACKCKEGRCVECRQCPRRSCKIDRCHCPGGPTRLRVPTKRKLGEIIADGQDIPATVPPAGNETTNSTNTDPCAEALGMTSLPQQGAMLPIDLQNKVLRYKPLEFPEDVMEALQLPKRQIMTRFQRRRIANGGMESFRLDATAFEKACCKRTVQTFQDGVKRLAELLLPEDPEYLMTMLPRPKHHTEADILKQVIDKSPRRSVQARTARAVLAAALPRNETEIVMTKYARKVAMKDWDRLREGSVLVEHKTDDLEEKEKPKGAKRKKTQKDHSVNEETKAFAGTRTLTGNVSAAVESTDTANTDLTIEQEAMLAMMRTMPRMT